MSPKFVFSTWTFLVLFYARSSSSSNGNNEERANLKTIFDLILSLGQGSNPTNEGNAFSGIHPPSRFDCPLCDTSVYSYCSDKLLHDACCCVNPFEHQLPLQCKYADCSFLHSNTCREHKLITACCCSKLLRNNVQL